MRSLYMLILILIFSQIVYPQTLCNSFPSFTPIEGGNDVERDNSNFFYTNLYATSTGGTTLRFDTNNNYQNDFCLGGSKDGLYSYLINSPTSLLGSIIVNMTLYSNSGTSGILVRTGLSKAALVFGGVIHATDQAQTQTFSRTSVGCSTSKDQFLKFLRGNLLVGFLKIERTTSTSFTLSFSFDGVTYWNWKTESALSGSVYWGMVKGGENSADYTYLGIKGLNNGCPSNQICRYRHTGATNSYCENDPATNFVECSQNTWRRSIIASSAPRPIFLAILADRINLIFQFASQAGSNDNYIFIHKLVSGSGDIVAKFDLVSRVESFVGLMYQLIMPPETPFHQNAMVSCTYRRNGDIALNQRTTTRTFTQVATATGPGTSSWMKLSKNGDVFTCSYSSTGTSWTDISSTANIAFGSSFYVGIISFDSSPAQTNRFTSITYSGFTGYCNNRVGAQCGTVNSNLDKCICPNSYVGDQCQFVACFGVDATSPSACSGRGTCTGPNTCNCNANFVGDNCQFDLCYGIASNNATVCSGRGACIGTNNCQCSVGYGGNTCNQPLCYGKLASDPTVCSGRGTCSGPDNCACPNGYFGTECQSYQCFGVDSTNLAVCSSRGTCQTPNVCQCQSNFVGQNCSVTSCFGIQSNNTNVCSSRGSCINFNTCSCPTGYGSNNCSLPICYGFLSNSSNVCSGKGTCVSPDQCTCQSGYGSPNCALPICSGQLSSSPSVCSGFGTCSSPNNCTCQTGYANTNCSAAICYGILSTNSSVCSGKGTCSSPNNCTCQTGYGSADCSAPICSNVLATNPSVCSGRGTCTLPNTCQCNTGYNGTNCENIICYNSNSGLSTVCSGNGTCIAPNTCLCKSGYFGNDCSVPQCYGLLSNASNVCSSRGSCFSPDNCICNAGFGSSNCSTPICSGVLGNNPAVCSSNGICVSPDNCACQSGWTGTNCQTFTCQERGSCNGNGNCIGPNNCNCFNGWTGSNCSVPICYGINATLSTVCSGGGRCVNPDTCVCNGAGITGAKCDISSCLGVNSCSGNGLCIGFNNCTCFDGWKGTNCTIPTCDIRNNCTFPNGDCVGPNTCGCTSSWSGSNCSLPVCFTKSSADPTVCSSKGSCIAPNNCVCNGNYSGNNCQFIQCFGKNSSNPTITCSGNGTCTSPDNCQCNTGFTGTECQFPICSGVPSSNPSVCSSRGNCNAPDNCICPSTHTGSICQFPVCYGVSSASPSVCSGVGTCPSPNNCVCSNGYTGNNCQFPICYGVNSSLPTVCSSQGNCTLPNNCVCNDGYYGNNCSNSVLWEFVQDLCNTSQGCSLNLAVWKSCTLDQGPSCFCNPGSAIQTSNTQIQCLNGKITQIKITNSGLTGSIRNIQILKSLVTLDLSSNFINVQQTLDNVLPNQIQAINLSNNTLSNQGTFYEINRSNFMNLTSYILDRNSICGIYPSTWINNTFGLSLNSHSKSLWCSTLNSNVCSLVSLPSFYVIYPSETQLFINFNNVPQTCEFYFQNSNLLCNSFNGTSLRSSSSYNSATKRIICNRSNLVTSVNQQLNLLWNFGSFFETVSSTISVSNLPFATITGIDKRVIFSSGSGVDTITIDVNQNMTRYRKDPANPVKCLIQPDNYAVTATSIDPTGTKLSCTINLLAPSQSPRTLTIVDDTNTFILSSNSIQFYLVNTRVFPNTAIQSRAQNITLRMANNQQIPTFSGLQYYLINSSIIANCSVSFGFITTCSLPSVTLSNDIEVMDFRFMEGNRLITVIPLLFYKNINVINLYPKGILADSTPNVITGQMSNSTFLRQNNLGGTFFALRTLDNSNFTVNPLNSTFFSFNDSSSSLISTNYIVYYRLSGFDDVALSTGGNQVHFIPQQIIYRESNSVIINGTSRFNFSITGTIPSSLSDSLSCRFEGQNQDYPLLYVSNNYFMCMNLASQSQQNISFWFIDLISGRNFRISSSPILLTFLPASTISFSPSSTIMGYENINYNPRIQLDSLNIPTSFNSRIECYQDNTLYTTSFVSSNTYSCQNVIGTQGLIPLRLMARIPNAFKVPNIISYYTNEVKLALTNLGSTMNTNDLIRIRLNTQLYISQGNMKSDCSDITVRFSSNEIGRSIISACNDTNTQILFNLQAPIANSAVDTRYSVVFGNPFKNTSPAHTITSERTPTISYAETANPLVEISSNILNFVVMTPLTISSSNPTSMITNSTFNLLLTTNFNPPDYQNLIQYQIRFSNFNYSTTLSNGVFSSLMRVSNQLNASMNIWAVYGTQSLLLSTSPYFFVFNAPMTLNYMLPFAGKYSSNTISQSIQIFSQTGFQTIDNLFCKQTLKGVTTFSPATVTLNSNILSCTISSSSLSLNTELMDINIWANVSSTNTSLNYDLGAQELTFVIFKEPITTSFPFGFRPSNFGIFYNLNFSNPLSTGKKISYQNYNVTLTPTILPNPSQNLNCNIGTTISCSISSITFSYVPIQLQFTLILSSSFTSQNFTVNTNPIWFIETLTFSTEFPFVLDQTPTGRIITFTTSKSLNTNFLYYCVIFGTNRAVTRLIPDNRFTCSFTARSIEESANFTLVLNSTTFSLPVLSDVSTVAITSLIFDLPYTAVNATDSFTIKRNSTASYKVPSKYLGNTYRVTSSTPSNTMPCSLSNGDIICNKSTLTMTANTDMMGIQFSLESNFPGSFTTMTVIQRPLVVYKPGTIQSISPLSGLRGSNVLVRITFTSSMFSGASSLPTGATFHCSSLGTSFSGSILSNTELSCSITSTNSQLYLSSFFRLPSYSSNQIPLASNNSNSIFNYLDAGSITFLSGSQVRFFLTNSPHVYNVTIFTNIPTNVLNFGRCRISGESIFSDGGYLSSSPQHSYTCSQTISSPGLKDLTLSIVEGTSNYQLSNNSLQVVYATTCNVFSYTPQASIANRTTTFVFKTTFASVNYGSSTYECRYGLDLNRTEFSVPATFSNSDFTCGIFYPDKDTKIYVSLWMTAFGTTRRISNSDTLVNVVTANYFTPSYGTPLGGESVRILVYEGPTTNVTYNVTNNFIFVCNKTQATLDCISPVVNNLNLIPLYSSQFLRFTNNSFIDSILSARFIFYERRSIISYLPSVVPASLSSFNMTIRVDKNTLINQGLFYLVVDPQTLNDRRTILLQTSNTTFNTTITPISKGGIYSMELYYYNVDSFEIQSMFSISSGVNVTFLESVNIRLSASSESNMMYLDTPTLITIQLETPISLDANAYRFIKCKLGNQVMSTTVLDSTNFNCNISSSTPKNDTVTLWYINSDAFQGEFRISTNSYDVIFVSPINIQTITPYASLSTSQIVDVATSAFINNYGPVSYQCEFNGSFSTATVNGNTFNCEITKNVQSSFSGVVSIYMVSQQSSKKILFTTIQAESPLFYFLNQIQILSIAPHTFQRQTVNFNVPITLSLASDILTTRNLTCELESNEGRFYTNATYGPNTRTVNCNVFKTSFVNSIENLNVRLYMDVSPLVKLYISSNFDQFFFVSKPITWSSSRFITEAQVFVMNVTLPSNPFTFELKTPRFTVPCIFTGTPNCSLTSELFNQLDVSPYKLLMNLSITHPTSGLSIPLEVDNIIIYYNTNIQSFKPFVISFKQRSFSPARIILNTLKKLDRSLSYRCRINQTTSGLSINANGAFDLIASEYHSTLDPESHISCSFTTFGISNSFYNISLEVQDPFSSSWNSLTTLPVTLNVVDSILLNPRQGPSTGGTIIQISNFNYLPQTPYQDYKITMKVYDRNGYTDFTGCTSSIIDQTIECKTPNIVANYRSWDEPSKKLRVDLIIDNVTALALTPSFTFYRVIDIQNILPSKFIYGLTPSNIRFITSPIEFIGQIIFRFGTQRFITCSIESSTSLLCPNVGLNQDFDFNLDYTLNGIDYISTGKTLTSFLAIPITSFSPSSLSMFNNTLITIKTTSSFLNSPNTIVRVSDNLLQLDVPGTFVDSQTITAIIPPFYDKNAIFPRRLKVSVSYDGVNYFADAPNRINVAAFPLVSITNFIPLNQRLDGLKLSGFPTNGIDFDASKTLVFRLVETTNSSNIIPLTCLAPYTLCNMVSSINTNAIYSLQIGLSESGIFTPIFVQTNTIRTYSFSPSIITGSSPQRVVRNSKNPLRIFGNFAPFSTASISLLFTSFTGLLSSSISSTASITNTGIQASLPNIPTSPLLSLSISFNDGVFYHPLGLNSTFINDFTISISNPDNIRDPNVFFTFLRSNVTVTGTNLIDTGFVKLTLSNSNLNLDITQLSPIIFRSSTLATFNAPLLSELNINYTLQFPLNLEFGLSLNGGVDTKYVRFIYNDQYPQPIYTSIFPSLTFRKPLNLTIYGLNLDLTSKCSFYDISNTTIGAEVYETEPISTGQSNTINCFVPTFGFSTKKLAVFLKNLQNIRGNLYYNLTFYDVPIITMYTPFTGESYGKFPLTVTGINFTYSEDVPKIYCRLNSFLCEEPCTYISSTQITCKSPSHPPGPSFLQISYNNIDWHASTQNITYTPCDAGYSTRDFTIPCTLCPSGTFKPTSGIYNCISCPNDTYSQFAGSLSCEKCADNTTTGPLIGARSPRDCVCKIGYYMNTNQEEVVGLNRKCIQCPEGGSCPTINTTIPLAKPGYWYDESDWTFFSSCLPAVSCPGGGFQNCTTGYTGIRCGVCARGYYRFKKSCDECGDLASSWLRLIGIAIGIAIVTAIFFALSATKVSHIASIAIAFSFWQVLSMFARFDIQWPGTISGTLTGASIANFNFDFLSPSCIFRDMNYITLWYLQMMLPVAFLVSFIILYILLIIRSLIASVLGRFIKISYINPKTLVNDDSDDENEPKKKESFIGKIVTTTLNFLMKTLIFIRNFIVWTFTEKSSYRELKKILNRIINAYFAFLSFSFIFIMTTASTVFVCKHQTNGSWTLNESPDIKCFEDGSWWAMVPFTVLWYIIFGGGSFIYFIVIWFKYDVWSKDTDFNERNKFMLARFRNKYYFWEAVVTLRKTVLSILYIFFKPMLVIVSGVLLLFIGFLIHIYFVPFKRKFHNVMDYFVILVTMATLFFGLLFFVNKWPDRDPITGASQLKVVSEWIAFFVLIFSTIIVVGMILWDSSTRRKKERKRLRKKLRKLILEQEEDRKTKQILLDLHDQKAENTFIHSYEMPWDVEFDYKPVNFKTDSESTSEEDLTMNEIFFDLFSKKRLKKKFNIIKKKGAKATGYVIKKIKGEKEEKKELKPIAREESIGGILLNKKTQQEYDYVLKKMEEEKNKTTSENDTKQRKKSFAGVKVVKGGILEELEFQIKEEDQKQKENTEKMSQLLKLKKKDKEVVNPEEIFETIAIKEQVETQEEPKEMIPEIKEEIKKEKPKIIEKKYPIITNRNELYPGPLEEFTYKEDPEENVVWEEINNQKSIKESTLEKLIELLTSPTYFDAHMQHTFMLTFRSFTDGETLFKKLIERFNIQSPPDLSDEEFAKWKVEVLDKIRLRISSTIKYWIENFYIFDFNDEKMKSYVDETMKMMEKCKGGKVFSQVIVRALSKAMDEDQKLIISQGECPPIEKPIEKRKSLFSGATKSLKDTILVWPSMEIARQLTLIEFSNFSIIQPKECLNQSWAKGQRETKAPGICAMVARFNQVSMWVGSTIVKAKEIDERVQTIEKFLDIADKLYELNNFNGVFTIISGLALSPIYRLKKSWPMLSEEAKSKHENLSKLISRDGNFKAIRERIKNVKPPAMPYIGIYLTDLTFIEDGNPKYINEKINFIKCKCFAGVIRDMQTYQNTKYFFTKATDLYEALFNVIPMTEKEMYDMSLEIEPKEKKQPK